MDCTQCWLHESSNELAKKAIGFSEFKRRLRMRLLPSERKEAEEKAISRFKEEGRLVIYEPCDCGSHVRHNNGGNYHEIITLQKDCKQVFVKYDDTCELTPDAEWEPCDDPISVIREHGDWL